MAQNDSRHSRLSDRLHWDRVHSESQSPLRNRAKALIARVLGRRLLRSLQNYRQHLLWDLIYPECFSAFSGGSVIEVGSAPGHHLVRLHQVLDMVPFGVDYSEKGVEVNRELFAANGLPPGNVFHADFFSEEFLDRHRGKYDAVVSHGFIEHFTDPRVVVRRHFDLLREGGRMLVTIPNLSGLNLWLTRFFHPEVLDIHNLDIMALESFRPLFDLPGMRTLRCGYYGTFDFYLFNTRPDSWTRFPFRACTILQVPLNLAFRVLFRDRGFDLPWLSPYLIFAGEKLGTDPASGDRAELPRP